MCPMWNNTVKLYSEKEAVLYIYVYVYILLQYRLYRSPDSLYNYSTKHSKNSKKHDCDKW